MSFAKIIQEEYGSRMGPKLKELFGYILDSIKRMSAIIDDLLRLAKYSKGKLKIVPVDMMLLTKDAWSNISRHTSHHALLELAELPMVQADESMMEQVIANLLSNAIKYSSKKERPVIVIWCEQAKDSVTFCVKDNGSGFDMKQSHRLFGAFQRLHGISEFEGTGVGLTLVKNIVEKHGGTVGAEGKVHVGATFYFTLPQVVEG
jgi:light-regulated signal transduction histidine kinase (bacteriophytochrome)